MHFHWPKAKPKSHQSPKEVHCDYEVIFYVIYVPTLSCPVAQKFKLSSGAQIAQYFWLCYLVKG